MAEVLDPSAELQSLLDRWGVGDATTGALFERADARFRLLARRMLRGYPKLRAKEQTDDVWQAAALRLMRALPRVRPVTVRDLVGLAGEQIRRELIDLARRHRRRPVTAEGGLSWADDASGDSERLERWAALHEAAGRLPEPVRQTFELVYYAGLTHAEAARILGVSIRTIGDRWRRARLILVDVFLD
jgi:RNA polymerase sigma-70 factor (ECF subfamily)